MFRHLDDPAPFEPDDRFRRAVAHRGRQLRRRRRLGAAAGGLTLTLVLATGAGALYVQRRDAAIDRVDVATAPSTDGAVNILVVGTDRRPVELDGALVDGIRADTIMVVRLEADGSVAVLTIPRYLEETGTGLPLSARGDDPDGLIEALGRTLGLPIDHYVQLDMQGFVDAVDQAGGLRLGIDVPLVDDQSGLHLPPTSCTTLDGATALALVRARHVEGDGSGDLGRMARAQAVLAAAVAQLAEATDDPAAIDRFSRILAENALVDDGLSLGRMVEIGRALAAAGPDGVQTATLPLLSSADQRTVYLAPDAAAVLHQFGAPADLLIVPAPDPATPLTVPSEAASAIHPC